MSVGRVEVHMDDDDDEAQKLYRFKWTNMDLERYSENARHRATLLRREAHILERRAEQIEEELAELRNSLEEHAP